MRSAGKTALQAIGYRHNHLSLSQLVRYAARRAGLDRPERFELRPGLYVYVTPEARRDFGVFIFEPGHREEMDAFLEEIQGCHRLMDVGAYFGVFSLAFAARTGGTVMAFEPCEWAFDILSRNRAANPEHTIVAVNKAVAADNMSTVTMTDDCMHSVPTPATGRPDRFVMATTVDAEAVGFNPDCLKVDVEGFEMFVLWGAYDTLSTLRPKLFVEVHPSLMALHMHKPTELLRLLDSLGYYCRLIGAPDDSVFRVVATHRGR